MAELLDIFGFVSVLLQGSILIFEALTVGGVIFAFIIGPAFTGIARLGFLLRSSSMLLAAAQSCYVAATAAILMDSADMTFAEVSNAGFLIAGALVVSGVLLVAASACNRLKNCHVIWAVACGLILSGSAMSSHAMARLDHRFILIGLTLVHHVAAAAWIGGIPYLILTLRNTKTDFVIATAIIKRFSRMAVVAVALLAAAGSGLSYLYVGSPDALAGTTYGIMLLSKVVLTLMLLALGAKNLQITLALRKGRSLPLLPLRRFAEVEAGIGFTILLTAASLTSIPPSIDVRPDLVTGTEIMQRMKPAWPRLKTPQVSQLSPASPLGDAPGSTELGSFVPGQVRNLETPADKAWSEYNHHWAGLVVLAIGVASILARRLFWARYWPLLFLGLAAFLLIRADPENWPLGPRGFWESFQVAEVAQHRLFVLLIIAFALFESAVQSGKLSQQRAGLVFPLVCAVGGALLLTHSHSLDNAKEEFLAELSHIPLAILAVAAGWSRWLEIRLPLDRYRAVAWVWPICFVLIGGILLTYRES